MNWLFAERLLGVPWIVLALVALAVAVVYLVVDTSGTTTGWQWVVLRWFHSLCWILLALGAVIMARIVPAPLEWAKFLAIAAGLTYAAFAITSLVGQP